MVWRKNFQQTQTKEYAYESKSRTKSSGKEHEAGHRKIGQEKNRHHGHRNGLSPRKQNAYSNQWLKHSLMGTFWRDPKMIVTDQNTQVKPFATANKIAAATSETKLKPVTAQKEKRGNS